LSAPTRLRVQVQETQATTINPCLTFAYGGTKDFTVVLGDKSVCPSGPATADDTNLGQVFIQGDTLTLSEQSDCPGKIGPQDFRALAVDLVRGNRYTVTYAVTTCGANWPVLSGVWADFNLDGKFTPDELLAPLSNGTGVLTQSVIIPNGTYFGNITARVQVQETFSFSIDPCADFPYGGTKDFTFIIKKDAVNYCQSGPTALGATALGPVSVIGAKNNIVNGNGCPGAIGPQDFTNQIADVIIGGAYSITYSVLSCTGVENPVVSTAWIDWDQNKIFSTWEQIVVDNTKFGNFTSLFKVPVSTPTQIVKTGNTRLRIQVQEYSTPAIDPCAKFSGGGTKDFSITVSAS